MALSSKRSTSEESHQLGRSACPEIDVPDMLRRSLRETREQLHHFQELQHRMEKVLRAWEKMEDGTPDDRSVCVLIESTLPVADHAGGAAPGAWSRIHRKATRGKQA